MLRALYMLVVYMKRFLALLALSSSFYSVNSAAEYDTLFIDLAAGDVMEHYRVGYGETPAGEEGEKVTSMFYVGYFASEDEISRGSDYLGVEDEEKVEILTLGAGGFGYLEDPQQYGGAEFDFELSQTKIDALDYDRIGLGFRTQLFIPVVAGLQANVGFNIRPFFLASDWNEQAQLEYDYQLGLEYAFSWDVALYGHYRYLSVVDDEDEEIQLAEGSLFGIRARF